MMPKRTSIEKIILIELEKSLEMELPLDKNGNP